MKKVLLLPAIMLLAYGCIKDTYDMDKLSDKMAISPEFAISAFSGDVSFSELVKQSDTVVYDQDKFVRLIFRKDSIINKQLKDLYNLQNMVSYIQDYTVGELTISPFQGTISFSLGEITNKLSTTLKNQITLLDDGGTHPFPALPSVFLGEKSYTAFPNFTQATFASGLLDITITNNLPAPLSGLNIDLLRSTDRTSVFGSIPVASVPVGQTKVVSVSLAGKTLPNTLIASVTLSGSSGNTNNVTVSLSNNNVQVKVAASNLKILSGRVILPNQVVAANNTHDVMSFNPGVGVEIQKLKMITGNLNYKIQSTATGISAALNVTMPSVLRNGTALQNTFNLVTGTSSLGTVSLNNTDIDLSTDLLQPFNRVPFDYGLQISSNNLPVTVSSTDKIHLELTLPDPNLDYVKGYFGQKVENLTTETIDLGIDTLLSKLTGTFQISNPIIRLKYSNSFGIPVEVALNGEGKRAAQTVSLGLSPLSIMSPSSLLVRDVSAVFVIDKNNSSLPQLISLPPAQITFSGSAKMNPLGDPSHLRNNYVFGNSRLLGSLEVEMPLEFRFANLQLSDTSDNFLKSDELKGFNKMLLKLKIKNGFPLGASFRLTVRDSKKGTKSSISDATILAPAPVDGNGKPTGTTDTETTIELTPEFLTLAKTADQVIYTFTLVTTGNGQKDVKIYSDNKIVFNVAALAKPELVF
jgi:hypothetical protein